jgi:hypothetical protein
MTVKRFLQEGLMDYLDSARNLIFDHDQLSLDGDSLRLRCDIFLNFINRELTGEEMLPPADPNRHRILEWSPYYALYCDVIEYRNGLTIYWKYNTELYTPNAIESIAEKLSRILNLFCRDPEVKTGQLTTMLIYEKEHQDNTIDLV